MVAGLLLIAAGPARGVGMGTAFTYQGSLVKGGVPVTNVCTFEFRLWNASSSGVQIGSTLSINTGVSDGHFSAVLDYGAGAFNGDARWLAITVQCAGDPAPVTLIPRVELTPVPYALYAANAGSGAGGGNTLDQAYDQGGPGAGRTITADAGAVNIAGADGLTVSGSVGVGTTAPTAKLHIAGTSGVDGIRFPDGTLQTTAGSGASAAWNLTGNAGTNPATNFLGTTDNQPLEASLNNTRVMRLEYDNTTPGLVAPHFNIIFGHLNNAATPGVIGGTISGGGSGHFFPNRATDWFCTVGGGVSNLAGNDTGTVSDASAATVSGGWANWAGAGDATVSGGSGNVATGDGATIGGGIGNTGSGVYSTVGGGIVNTASHMGSIGGGESNTASGNYSTVGGGYVNTASGNSWSTVGGGYTNTASGDSSTVPGGFENIAAGENSFAAGSRARANIEGMFVWNDSIAGGFFNPIFPSSTESNFTPHARQFLARATGGVVFVTGVNGATGDSTAGVQVTGGGGSWSSLSDRNAKDNFAPVDSIQVLDAVASLSITTWNYRSQQDSIRHIGPMAQDFHAAFGVGEDEKFITTIDADGVALAAIQGLHQIVQEKDCEIQELREEKDREIAELRERLAKLELALNALTRSNVGGGR
jgi:hypothetical protein